MEEEAGEIFEIERILDRRRRGKTYEYYIRWKGYDSDEDQWVKEKDIYSTDLVKDYNRSVRKTPTRKTEKQSTSVSNSRSVSQKSRKSPPREPEAITPQLSGSALIGLSDSEGVTEEVITKTTTLTENYEITYPKENTTRETDVSQLRSYVFISDTEGESADEKEQMSQSLTYPRNRFITSRQGIAQEEDEESSQYSESTQTTTDTSVHDTTDNPDTATYSATYTSTAQQTSLFKTPPPLSYAYFTQNATQNSFLDESAVSSTDSSLIQGRKRGLIQLTVYDIPLVIFISCLLFLLISFVVQKHGSGGAANTEE